MTFNWDDEKNAILKRTRNISFEEIVVAIEDERVIDVVAHHNPDRYPNQFIYLVDCRDYVWVVPHVVDFDGDEIFLKTIYPSRKLTKQYRGGRKD